MFFYLMNIEAFVDLFFLFLFQVRYFHWDTINLSIQNCQHAFSTSKTSFCILNFPNLGIVFTKTNKMVPSINNWILFQNFCCLSQIWSKLTFSLELACCNYLYGQFGHCLFWRKTRWSSYQIVCNWILVQKFCCLSQIWSKIITFSLKVACRN